MRARAGERNIELLLVEDNPGDVLFTEEALQELSMPVRLSVVADGEAALLFVRRIGQFASAPRPDLILLDLNLPKMSGTEVLAELKRDPALRRIPVVVSRRRTRRTTSTRPTISTRTASSRSRPDSSATARPCGRSRASGSARRAASALRSWRQAAS
jgi:CheY-like chemotaxis protein